MVAEEASTGVMAANMGVLAVILLYYILSTAAFVRYRSVPWLQQRSILLTLVFTFAACLLTIAHMTRPLLYVKQLCMFPVWYNYLLLPTCLITLLGRLLRIALSYRKREAAVRQVEAFAVADAQPQT
ncbi:hypothetical protein THASP1DRAFT_23585, partial [Thamnocephalis sphaerospora]